jgi:hypothetical protein
MDERGIDGRTKYSVTPGQAFGRLTVVGNVGQAVTCTCVCGKTTVTMRWRLYDGTCTSCGCYQQECRSRQTRTHGMSRTPVFRVYMTMIARCHNPKASNYARYGGRGIVVCDEWRESFEAFYRDMGDRPSEDHSIEREDNNGPYSRENCRWATRDEQTSNTRRTRRLTFKGRTETLTVWARETGLSVGTLWARVVTLGWPAHRALTQKLRK